MPIASGARGRVSTLAAPGLMPRGGWTPLGDDMAETAFRSRSFSTYNATITGITKDSTGATLAACQVQLFRTVDDAFIQEVASDGVGAYVLTPTVSGPFYIVAYKAGSPDVAGTSVNTLVQS